MEYLVVYDICNPKRLRRVEKMMRGFGYRVQKSVFECDLNKSTVGAMREQAGRIIDPDKDSIRLYPLLDRSREKQLILGQGEVMPLQGCLVV
jgi:CRISPR-associated protein Cas2